MTGLGRRRRSVSELPILLVLAPLLLWFGCTHPTDRERSALPSHISFSVDDATFAELRESGFLLNDFAGTSVKTSTVDSGLSWTGVYLYGRNTYLEFYPEEEDIPAGSCSTAFEVARAGELKRIKARLEGRWGRSLGEIELRTKVTDGSESPWFHYLDLYGQVGSGLLSPWLLEWDPDVLNDHYQRPIEALVDSQGKRPDDPAFKPERILGNFIEIDTSLDREELDGWTRFLDALGFLRTDEDDLVRFSSDDLTFNFRLDSKERMLELKMSLLREPQDMVELNFGKRLRLIFNGDKTASLFFRQK
jgi:hypothetical protein